MTPERRPPARRKPPIRTRLLNAMSPNRIQLIMHIRLLFQSALWLGAACVGFPLARGLAADHAYGPDAARQALKSFTVAPGLAVTLFASEPMVRNPTDMDIDERGRVWITEGVNYRSSFQKWGILQPAGDRIIVLEDTRGTGAADKETVFYQDPSINAALGICVLGNKVIVSRSPDVFVLTDTDGDGKADKRELLFAGIRGVDHDHGVHAFVFGPDGKLYFNYGNESRQLEVPVGSREIPLHGPVPEVALKPAVDLDGNVANASGHPYRMGMVFRCNPDGSSLETLAWNFRNEYEICVDSFGTLWQSDNDDDGNRGVRINYVMPFGNYGYVDEMTGAGWTAKRSNMEIDIPHRHWHQNDPGVIPNLLFTGAGAPTGMILYEGDLLPPVFRNQMIHCDAGPRVVRAYPVTPDGAGYQARIVDILSSTDTWFRPCDVCAAPDGSIYVADWNDAGVGGHYMADQKLETMTGRIYRIAPQGNQPSVPRLNLNSAAGCVAALQSPNLATRYLAWTTLHAMGDRAEKSLLKLWHGQNPRMRARALQLLARIPGQEQVYIDAALADADPDIRITGLRIAVEEKRHVIPAVQALVKDPSPQVRRESAIALRHNSSPEAPHLWAELAAQHDGKDRWYLEALGIGADKQWEAFLDAWLADVGGNWNTPAGRDIIWRSRSKKTPELLVKIITDKNTPPTARPRYFRSLDFITGPEKDAALVQLLTSQ
ncbi:MAG: PQQ-dependent sugar dehydrogenase [Verrucomicrobia bacterium]|nr:PQQ-dependent sugar dehydrogenase [Verrucomicrobiota bacterium]